VAKWLDGSRQNLVCTASALATLLDGDPAPLPQRDTALQFSAHICCGQLPSTIRGRVLQFLAHVSCRQTAGLIKMALGMEVGLGRGHIVVDGDSAFFPKKGAAQPPIFGPSLLWPNGWMDQDATWYGGRPQRRRHCVRSGPSSPQRAQPPIFGPCLLWPHGCMYQDTTL